MTLVAPAPSGAGKGKKHNEDGRNENTARGFAHESSTFILRIRSGPGFAMWIRWSFSITGRVLHSIGGLGPASDGMKSARCPLE